MSIICLTTCADSIEANMIKSKLEQSGIRCYLTNENYTSLYPNYAGMGSGIQVMIDEKDYDEAIKLVDGISAQNAIKCPGCESTNVEFKYMNGIMGKLTLLIIALLGVFSFGNKKSCYVCKDCGTAFKG